MLYARFGKIIEGRKCLHLKGDSEFIQQSQHTVLKYYYIPVSGFCNTTENYGDFAHSLAPVGDAGSLVKVTVWSRDRDCLATIQVRFNLVNRATANNYVIGLAQFLIDAADKLNLTPEALIEKLDEAQSNDTMTASTSKSDRFGAASKARSLFLKVVKKQWV